MTFERRIEDYIFYFIIGSLYAFGINLSIISTTILYVTTLQLYLIGLGVLVFFAIIFFNRITTIISLVSLLAVWLFIYVRRQKMEDFWHFANELYWTTRGVVSFREEFILPMLIIICLLSGLFIAVCMYVNFNFYLLAGFGVIIFVSTWMMDYNQSMQGFALYLFCFCVFLIRKLQGGERIGVRVSLVVTPLCALIVWSATVIPMPKSPIDSTLISRFLDDPLEVAGEAIYLAVNPKHFSFQTTGFGGRSGRLGGAVTPNDRPVMGVDAPRRVYLSGATGNIYTGNSWTSDDTEFITPSGAIDPSYIEFLETSQTLIKETGRFENGGHLISYLPLNYIDIYIGNNRTASLFRPLMERGAFFDDPQLNYQILVNQQGDRRMEQLLPTGMHYRYNFLNIDYQDPRVEAILMTSQRGFYGIQNREKEKVQVAAETWEGTTIEMPIFGTSAKIDSSVDFYDLMISRGATLHGGEVAFLGAANNTDVINRIIMKLWNHEYIFEAYAEHVYDNNTQLPDTLPQRVIDLAKEITKDYETDYEKIYAIKEYLTHIPYTLTPNNVPAGRDFVDFFLFDEPQGYCVYYASAMVIMARAIGLPARYVEGFLTPTQRDAETGIFIVTNRNAHAWAEVYFEGFGWAIVEATTPYANAVHDTATVERPTGLINGGTTASWGANDQTRESQMISEQSNRSLNFYSEEVLMSGGSGNKEEPSRWQPVLVVIVSVLGLIGTYLAVNHILRFNRRRKLSILSTNQQVMHYYREIIKLTEYKGYPLLEGETTQSYGKRMRGRVRFVKGEVTLQELNDLYYNARYSANVSKCLDVRLIKICYYELVTSIKNTKSWHYFAYIKYIKNVISL